LFVDVLRLFALLQMINGHTLDAVLAEAPRTGEMFQSYRFVRGLVSVAFLLVAGISFYLTTLARFDRHRSDPQAVQRRFWRAAEIVLVGYLLQLRWPPAYFDPAHSAEAWRALFRCEVLQCIGASLCALELITLLARSARQALIAASVSALALFALAPYGQLASETGAASFWRGLVGHGQGSQFPLLPWAGYVFVGVVVARVALPASGLTPLARRLLALCGLAMGSALLSRGAFALPWPRVLASSAPWFVLQKLAVILVLLVLLALATHRLRRLPAPLALLGGETLAIFVFHLQVIYGGSWSLGRLFPRTLPLSHAIAASLLNLALSVAFAFAWRALKRRLAVLRAQRPLEIEGGPQELSACAHAPARPLVLSLREREGPQ
jgi:hypothetical protein